MKKIVELRIDQDELEFEGLGVDIMSLVDNPAIGVDWMAFSEQVNVDNSGFEKFEKFFNDNLDLFKKPGGGAAGEGGVNHGEQMKVLAEAGINTEYPFGYCFQVAQFLFYAVGGYKSKWELKLIKGMEYQVNGVDFKSTHWYIQNSENGRIVDLTASQFDGLLDIKEWYADGRNGNLGYPYYNVDGEKVVFENTVPSLQSLKLYDKWREEYGKLEVLETYYQACKYEELRKAFADCDDCFDGLEDACWPGYEAIGTKIKDGREVPNCVPIQASEEFSYSDYPEAVSNNAKRGIELNEKQGNACATQVGKIRAQQLANGENVSLETVERMYSYLSRAEAYYDENDTEACGTISYLLWGGKAGLRWAKSKLDEIANEKLLEIAASNEFGETYNEECVIIDGTKESFTTIGEWAKGVIGLDILGKRIDKETSETKYRYAGPIAERNFCRAMQRLQKLYTWEELKEMGRRVGNGMPVYGSAAFNLIDWKGGPNCKHYWEEVKVFKKDGRAAMMISKGPAAGQMGRTPANSDNNGYKMSFQFADEEQRIIVGPAMIPQQLIPRRDAMGNVFHVYFTKETIKKIAEKFLRENKHNNTDVNHDDEITTTNTLLESWIVEDPKFDKSAKYGYNLPEGAWMVSYKINDEETWQKIKNGDLKGFSVAGNFIEKAIKKSNA